MKKILCLTLAAILVLGLFACGAKEPEEPAVFKTGYGRADVTPVASVPLGGYGQTDKRKFENILDNLYVSCVAFQDTEGTIGMVLSMDVISSTKAPNIRQKIEAETGVPQANIMVAATHTHSAPDQNKAGAFVGPLEAGAVEAAKEALADLAPTTIPIGGTETERIFELAAELIECPGAYADMAHAVNPYGDGKACRRIVDAIEHYFGLCDMPPEEFNP